MISSLEGASPLMPVFEMKLMMSTIDDYKQKQAQILDI